MKWEKAYIGDCCDITSSKRVFFSDYVDFGIPFFRSKEIIERSENKEISEPLYISKHKYMEIKQKYGVPQCGDMLLTSVGTIGIPYLVKADDVFYFKDGNLTWFKDFSKDLLSKYLFYWIRSKEGQGVLNNSTIGSSQKALTIAALKKIEIPLPPIRIQYGISSVLSFYDSLIENNQKQIKLLEEAAQRLYKEWFVDLRFPGHETTTIIDGVPEGWTEKRFYELFSFVRGKSYTSKELSDADGILMVNLKSIRPFGGFRRNQEKHYIGKYNADQILEPGDIVMGVTDMTKERRLVGHVALVPDLQEKATFSMDLIKITPFSLPKSYLYSVFHFGGLSAQISQLANGVNVLHLKPEAMKNKSMLCPTEKIISDYDKLFETIQYRIEVLQKECDFAVETRDRLLPKLMSGEIEV